MTNKTAQMTRCSRLAVVVSFALAVGAAACGDGGSAMTSPSGVNPSSLAANGQSPRDVSASTMTSPSDVSPSSLAPNGQSTRDFGVTVAPTSVSMGAATLHVTLTRDATSGQSQQLGSVEIYVPSGFAIQSVSHLSNGNWTSGVSGQTVRVGAETGNQKLDGTTGRISVTFDINVTSTECATYTFKPAQASNSPYSTDPFDQNWTYTGGALSVTVNNCVPVVVECKAAPAVANEYLDSMKFTGGRGVIINNVSQHMTEGARFDGIDKCEVKDYRRAVIGYVIANLP